jgi:hypothetical protein
LIAGTSSQNAKKSRIENLSASILDSQPRVRLFSLEYTQLLTEGEDLQTEAVTGTEDGFEEDEQADQKRNHRPGFIS